MSGSPDAGHAVIRTKLDSGICQKRIARIPSTRPNITVVIFLLRSGESSELWRTMIRRSWSGYAPVEATLEVLASALRDVKGRMRQLFAQERTAVNAGLFLDGLLSEEQRKTGWVRLGAGGDGWAWGRQGMVWRDPLDAQGLGG